MSNSHQAAKWARGSRLARCSLSDMISYESGGVCKRSPHNTVFVINQTAFSINILDSVAIIQHTTAMFLHFLLLWQATKTWCTIAEKTVSFIHLPVSSIRKYVAKLLTRYFTEYKLLSHTSSIKHIAWLKFELEMSKKCVCDKQKIHCYYNQYSCWHVSP